MVMKRTAGAALLGLLAAACGGDDQPPPATPVPTATAPTPPPPDTSAGDAAAPPPKLSMAEMQANVEKGFVATAQDPAKLAALFATDGVEWNVGEDPATGRDAIQAHHAALLAGFPDLKVGDAQMWTNGNTMVIHWVATATDKASGKPAGLHGLDIIALNDDGLITTDHSYFDGEVIMKQTGAYAGQTPAPAVPALPTSLETHTAKNDAIETTNAAAVPTLTAAWVKKDDKTYLAGYADSVAAWDGTDYATHDKKWMTGGLAALRKAVDVTAYKDTNVIAAEDFTIDESEVTFTQKAAYNFGKVKVANTKKSATTHGVEIDQWKDGKIVKSWNFGSNVELDKQLGIGPFAPAKAAGGTKPKAPPGKATTTKSGKPASSSKP